MIAGADTKISFSGDKIVRPAYLARGGGGGGGGTREPCVCATADLEGGPDREIDATADAPRLAGGTGTGLGFDGTAADGCLSGESKRLSAAVWTER